MSLLIATDEAGYGPRLGPLVIVATAWRLQPGTDCQSAHHRLSEPLHIDAIGELRIDDSKRLFTRRNPRRAKPPIDSALDLLSDAAAAWTSLPLPSKDFRQWLLRVAPDDLEGLSRQPWFASLATPAPAPVSSQRSEISQSLIDHWSGGGLHLVGIAARVIDAARFNRLLDSFANKADLLSHTTCELAIGLWQQQHGPATPQTQIFSDRHGGRAYYGALVQHHCPELNMRVLSESAICSRYLLDAADTGPSAPPMGAIQWTFTVGGDSYPPVALSSVIAKATRERLMGRFNDYFRAEAALCIPGDGALRPTAGYALDATRFLDDIRSIRTQRSLSDTILIRRK